ncbi:MAG: epimerase [Flavobacteriales bacterium]|nr:epimerase [Flavobacteriales bacterium]
MKVVITGTTGMVGKGVLYVCLEDESIDSVLTVSRSTCGIEHPKLKEILHNDFMDVSPLQNEMAGYDACFFCLGVSAAGLNEAAYTKLTYDLTLHFASTFLAANPNAQFSYISGAGTDSSEKGRMMWARVKGRTENTLLNLGFSRAWMFRPGFIQPMRGIRSKTAWYQFFYNVLSPFYSLLRKLPKYVTDTDTLGRAMIRVAREGYKGAVLESIDINAVGRQARN